MTHFKRKVALVEQVERNDRRPIATFDLTGRCPLRCKHCYFYAAQAEDTDLERVAFLDGLLRLRDTYDIQSAFWIGGEPLLRLGTLRRGLKLFRRNAIATSGMIPIPNDLGAGILVSVDGLEAEHDYLRGRGTFQQALENVSRLKPRSFGLSTTLTTQTVRTVENLPVLLEKTQSLGVLVGFHVGPSDDSMVLTGDFRNRAVDQLLEVKKQYPDVLLNTKAGLEMFRPRRADHVKQNCIYRTTALAFDTQLRPKPPCTFGVRAGCHACGCPIVAEQRARELGEASSEALLRALFPKHALN